MMIDPKEHHMLRFSGVTGIFDEICINLKKTVTSHLYERQKYYRNATQGRQTIYLYVSFKRLYTK